MFDPDRPITTTLGGPAEPEQVSCWPVQQGLCVAVVTASEFPAGQRDQVRLGMVEQVKFMLPTVRNVLDMGIILDTVAYLAEHPDPKTRDRYRYDPAEHPLNLKEDTL